MDRKNNVKQSPAGIGPMLFLDSADPEQWNRLLPLGIFYGTTTNPLLLERAGQSCTVENLAELTICASELGAQQIHLQTWGNSAPEMIANGLALAEIAKHNINVAVKIPATKTGFVAAKELRNAGCTITMTAAYSPGQVLAAAGLGAAYIAPYLGRLNDTGKDGMATITTMHEILKNCGSSMRLLVASLRSVEQIIELARCGFETLTFGPDCVDQLLEDELTELAERDFQRAAREMG